MVGFGALILVSTVPYLIGIGGVLLAAGVTLGARARRPAGPSASAPSDCAADRGRAGPAAVAQAAARPRPTTPLSAHAPKGSRATVGSGERRASDEELAEVAKRLAFDRRKRDARARLRDDLNMLDRGRWHVEPDVILGGVTIPFVVFGPTGVFALAASPSWSMQDLTVLDAAAKDLASTLPGYPDPVRAAIYVPYGDEPVRCWFNGAGAGGWIVGRGRLHGFFDGVDDRGMAADDIAELRARVPQIPAAPIVRFPDRAARG